MCKHISVNDEGLSWGGNTMMITPCIPYLMRRIFLQFLMLIFKEKFIRFLCLSSQVHIDNLVINDSIIITRKKKYSTDS
jgi:hypothetical protein